ncbi:MAG: deoxyuridine 5'-triphosphate nucleotidohydrolase [Lachnospiraceae bacterium]|nr:deoxyuridine 5'-triphosphate nucleotidohydrolase [Lachnospiraceae bacterium]
MNPIAEFQKVSEEIFVSKACELADVSSKQALSAYRALVLPKRATVGSAGYDFTLPFDISLKPGEWLTIPTGIRVRIDDGWVLLIVPRSGLGARYRFQLNNSTGVIDSDYYHTDNEGHIMVPMINDNREGKTLELKAGTAFAQGVFVPCGIAVEDEVKAVRTGGFGSTSR